MDRYYKVSINSETGLKLKALIDKATEFDKKIDKLREKYGFKNYWHSSFYYKSLDVVELQEEPDMTVWKKEKDCFHGYSPRMKSKNKEVLNDFKELAELRIRRDELDDIIGNDSVFCHAGFDFTVPEFYLFTVDREWKCKTPKDCKEISNIEFEKLTTKNK